MSRYRPPDPPKTALITQAGFLRLREELNHLWKTKRPEVTARVAAAAALGDRSENADYIYGKRQLAEIDRRVRYLDKRLSLLKVVDGAPSDQGRVYFAAWVTLAAHRIDAVSEALSRRYRIVGPDEIDADPAYISIDSPMAKALLGKALGEVIDIVQSSASSQILSFQNETARNYYEIVSIEYT